MDPKKTDDGKIWAKERFLAIIKERHFISSRLNTSYNDVGKISPFERGKIISYIAEEDDKTQKLIDEAKQQRRQQI